MQRLQAISTGNICPCRLSPLCPPPSLQLAGRGLFFLLCCVVLPLCVAIFAVTIWAAFAADEVLVAASFLCVSHCVLGTGRGDGM